METPINTILSKKEILSEAIRRHESVMKDFRDRIRDMDASNADDSVEEREKYHAEATVEINFLREQLDFASNERDELLQLEPACDVIHDRVEFGAVVVTDKKTFFVSASIEDFTVGGYPLFGLSVHTPIYKVMKGMRKGDTFSYGAQTYHIQNIF